MVSGSARSPARKITRQFPVPISRRNFPSGSSLRMARMAVGAVKKLLTPWAAMVRQKVPGSGVPIGLPSNRTVVAPTNSGA